MSNKINDTGEINLQLCNIFKIKNKAICLLCMENVSHDNKYVTTKDEGLISHLQSATHKMKVKSLFSECASTSSIDSRDTEYSDLVNSFIFDTSLFLGNEPSYVTICGYYVTCLICSMKLFNANIDGSLVDVMLFDHLQSKLHRESMKSWICWIYFLNDNHNYVMISCSVLYCSFCKETIGSTVNGLLHDFVDHLENNHNLQVLRRSENTRNNNYYDHDSQIGSERAKSHHVYHLHESSEGTKNQEIEANLHLKRSDVANKDDHLENIQDHNFQRSAEIVKKKDNLEIEHGNYQQRDVEYTGETNYDKCSQKSFKELEKNDHLGKEHDHYSQKNAGSVKEHYHRENMHILHQQQIPEETIRNDYLENENNCYPQRSAKYAGRNDHIGNEDVYHLQYTAEGVRNTNLENEDVPQLQECCVNEVKKNIHQEKKDVFQLQRSSVVTIENNHHHENEDVHQIQTILDENVKKNDNLQKEDVYCLQRCSNEDIKKKVHLDNEDIDYQLKSSDEDIKKNDDLENEDAQNLQRNADSASKSDHLENEFGPFPQKQVNDEQTDDHSENKHDLDPQKCGKDALVSDSNIKECKNSLSKLSGNKSDDQEDYLNELDSSESSDIDSYDDTLEVLTCPTCGEFIEIINENAEFSFQLHLQKHRDLKSLNVDGELEFDSNVDYVCPICEEVIPIFNKNIELSVSHHFEERKVDHEGFGFTKDDKFTPDVLACTFSKLPESLKKHESFLLMENNSIFCKLCICTVPIKNLNNDIAGIIHEHLTSSYHQGQYKSLSQDLAMVVVDFNKQYKSDEQLPDLFKTLVIKHPLIKENRQFIEKTKIHYFCQLCQRHICHSPNENTLKINFMLHLKGTSHKHMLKEMGKNSVALNERSKQGRSAVKPVKETKDITKTTLKNMIFELSRVSFAVNMNKRYIEIKDDNLFCSVCLLSIKFTKGCSHLISHLNSFSHNETLRRNAFVFVSRLSNDKGLNRNIGKLKADSKELPHLLLFKPHLTFIHIDKQDYRCVICNVVIAASKKCLQNHFVDAVHKKNAYLANQQVKDSQHNPHLSSQGLQSTVGNVKNVNGPKKKRQRRRRQRQ